MLRRIDRRRRFAIAAGAGLLLSLAIGLGWHWSREPARFLDRNRSSELPAVAGYVSVTSLIDTIEWLLDKPGGYLSNDVFPPSLWLDNMPSFEFGVLVQARDLARSPLARCSPRCITTWA
jgi:hypothetical protein